MKLLHGTILDLAKSVGKFNCDSLGLARLKRQLDPLINCIDKDMVISESPNHLDVSICVILSLLSNPYQPFVLPPFHHNLLQGTYVISKRFNGRAVVAFSLSFDQGVINLVPVMVSLRSGLMFCPMMKRVSPNA